MTIRGFNKYGNKRYETSVGKFDSKLEMSHFAVLALKEKGGLISDLRRQVKIVLSEKGRCSYIADFVFYDNERKVLVVADSKGFETAEFKVKLKWLLDKYCGFEFILLKRGETIVKKPFGAGIDLGLYLGYKG